MVVQTKALITKTVTKSDLYLIMNEPIRRHDIPYIGKYGPKKKPRFNTNFLVPKEQVIISII